MPPSPAFPRPPAALHQPRGRWVRALGRAYLRLGGWRIEGTFPAEPKVVAIVAPHTSNWDFFLGLAILFALEFRASWLGKHTLFRGPAKRLLLRLGGIPVDRRASRGVVDDCVGAFEAAPALLLALAPEGTRKGAQRWRTGFYQIAAAAGVPILPVGFDFGRRTVHLMPVFRPTGNQDRDLPLIQGLFREVRGLRTRGPRTP